MKRLSIVQLLQGKWARQGDRIFHAVGRTSRRTARTNGQQRTRMTQGVLFGRVWSSLDEKCDRSPKCDKRPCHGATTNLQHNLFHRRCSRRGSNQGRVRAEADQNDPRPGKSRQVEDYNSLHGLSLAKMAVGFQMMLKQCAYGLPVVQPFGVLRERQDTCVSRAEWHRGRFANQCSTVPVVAPSIQQW